MKLGDKGSAAVEFALVLPLLVLVLFGIIDFGRLFYVQLSVTSASQEVARSGSFSLEGYLWCNSSSPVAGCTPSVDPDLTKNLIAVATEAALSAADFAQLSGQETLDIEIVSACSLSIPGKDKFVATVSIPFKWTLPISSWVTSSGGEFTVKSTGVMRCQV